MPDNKSDLFADHYVLFIDFLGFAEAAEHWDDGRAAALAILLSELSTAQSSFEIDGSARQDGSGRIKIVPDITTFSDHIVASFPLAADIALAPHVIDPLLHEADRIVASIAFRALGIGLLIRGGLTYGKLFHQGRVVMGEAMNDAYRLERQVASYPRIVVSPRIYSRLPAADRPVRLLQDRDGVLHVNYFPELIRQAASSAERLRAWRATIDESIQRLEAVQALHQMAKWAWFKDRLEEAMREA